MTTTGDTRARVNSENTELFFFMFFTGKRVNIFDNTKRPLFFFIVFAALETIHNELQKYACMS